MTRPLSPRLAATLAPAPSLPGLDLEVQGGLDNADSGGEWTVVGAKGIVSKRGGAAADGGGRPHKKKAKRALELAAFLSTDVYHQARVTHGCFLLSSNVM